MKRPVLSGEAIASILLTMLVGIAASEARGAGADVESNPLLAAAVQAFNQDPLVREEAASFERDGYTQGSDQVMSLGGGCGFAGCDTVLLIARTFSTKGSNPQTRTVLATVSIRSPGFRDDAIPTDRREEGRTYTSATPMSCEPECRTGTVSIPTKEKPPVASRRLYRNGVSGTPASVSPWYQRPPTKGKGEDGYRA
jgi:hypothetical protein